MGGAMRPLSTKRATVTGWYDESFHMPRPESREPGGDGDAGPPGVGDPRPVAHRAERWGSDMRQIVFLARRRISGAGCRRCGRGCCPDGGSRPARATGVVNTSMSNCVFDGWEPSKMKTHQGKKAFDVEADLAHAQPCVAGSAFVSVRPNAGPRPA